MNKESESSLFMLEIFKNNMISGFIYDYWIDTLYFLPYLYACLNGIVIGFIISRQLIKGILLSNVIL